MKELKKSIPWPDILKRTDPEIFSAIQQENQRQTENLELIASENYTSPSVLSAQGSILTNKYAEGYPGKRYYGGCKFVDICETLAQERGKQLFSAEHINVQPHSGSQANMAVYFTIAKAGERIQGMNLSHGGHLTHGSPVNFSGFIFESSSYGLNPKTGWIDYNRIEEQAKKQRPKILIAGHSAYPRTLDFRTFKSIAESIQATLVVDMAHFAGLVAAGLHSSPIPYADFVTSTTHKTLRGPRGGFIICKKRYSAQLDKTVFPGIQGGPLAHVIAGKAVAFQEAATDSFKKYARQIIHNAKVLAESLNNCGFHLVTGGTDNHIILVDLSNKNITGKKAETVLETAGITLNKNTIPGETKSPFVTSGIRMGTPALTTRGMGTDEMRQIAVWIQQAINKPDDTDHLKKIANEVKELCKRFPCPTE